MSDVPLGAFLSGGIDSSAVVGLMSSIMERPVKTYTVGFDYGNNFDETAYARKVSKDFRTEHHELILKPDVTELLDKIIWHLDEPIADPAIIPTYLISKLASQDVTVVLTGEGADELFVGYGHYAQRRVEWKMEVAGRLPIFFQKQLFELFKKLPKKMKGHYFITHYAPYTGMPFERRYLKTISCWAFNRFHKESLYTDDMCNRIDENQVERDMEYYYQRVKDYDILSKMQYLDIKFWLADDLLMKVDKMSMANSIEARVPFLDRDLVEFVTSIPCKTRMGGHRLKNIFKKSMQSLLSPEIIDRKKHGFDVPISQWIRSELKNYIQEMLSESTVVKRGYFRYEYIKSILDRHNSQREDWSWQIWSLLNFEIWHRIFIDGENI